MYEATDQASSATEYPAGSQIRESDWHILAGFWHPVAFSTELEDGPVASRLLDRRPRGLPDERGCGRGQGPVHSTGARS